MKPKIIAFYLPQFHAIPENDKWWGKGFTEWTNVKKAKPLFRGHDEPRIPYQQNYYNLLNSETREWQAALAKKYGVYAFCYYHYWFMGKKLLESPIEEVLKSKKPDMPFCFSWANESWSRTWYGFQKETLLEQEYGGREDWKKHFEYLLPFFKDARYIKVDNKPLFLIYKPSKFDQLDSMIECWNELAIKEGFHGMHIVETLTATQKESCFEKTEGIVFYEPGYAILHDGFWQKIRININSRLNSFISRFSKRLFLLNKMNYERINKGILKRNLSRFKKKVYLGSFVSYDDTPRKNHRGIIFDRVNPKSFEKHLTSSLNKSEKIKSPFLFLTAWNEWAEGAYLEPDEKSGYDFLEAISRANRNS